MIKSFRKWYFFYDKIQNMPNRQVLRNEFYHLRNELYHPRKSQEPDKKQTDNFEKISKNWYHVFYAKIAQNRNILKNFESDKIHSVDDKIHSVSPVYEACFEFCSKKKFYHLRNDFITFHFFYLQNCVFRDFVPKKNYQKTEKSSNFSREKIGKVDFSKTPW